MTPSDNASPFEPSERPLGSSTLRLPKTRGVVDTQSLSSSISTLPFKTTNASVSSLFASTSTPSGSRSVSPSGVGTPSAVLLGSVFRGTPGEQSGIAERLDDPRNLILQAFVPHIAIHTSVDTQELVKDKGFDGGLWEILRPYGEQVQGKVTVRDSTGAGRTWEDFAVRFVQLGDGLEAPEALSSRNSAEGKYPPVNGSNILSGSNPSQQSRTGGDITSVETLVDRHLRYAEEFPKSNAEDYLNFKGAQSRSSDVTSPFYTLFLRRLLSGLPLAPHETFSHPVACVIAISSRNTSPIETLRNLYDESRHGDKHLPSWVNNEYLRYYVLVHDEERDDITKSMTLFEQMKRHFGLHCHLLRLRSSRCVVTDDDSVRLPRPEWLAATEEIAEIQATELEEEPEDAHLCIYESDMTAIKSFIREMVTQSIIPTMERCVATWNDQVASRRRGISGRFLNMSKKWGVFGSSSRSTSSNGAAGSSSNYDAAQGFYRPDTPEAIMRKLADYAFMLRDWKLAQSTYDLLRSDFNSDKAWKYHAAANEMAAISTLMTSQAISSKVRAETIDQMLETASYSYITRCGAAYGALRSLALGMELLKIRGGSSTAEGAKWGVKILEYKVVGVIGDALVKERISACYAAKRGAGSGLWGSRTRKSALWSVQAGDAWLTLGKPHQSQQRLNEAKAKYSSLPAQGSLSHFSLANQFLEDLEREVQLSLYPESGIDGLIGVEDMVDTSEESEIFVSRPHRKSLMGAGIPPLAYLENAPLNMSLGEAEDYVSKLDSQFE